jgi:hypothetical protein
MFASSERRVSVRLRVIPLPYKPTVFYTKILDGDGTDKKNMPKQTPKIIVPPRAERYEEMGDPKPPKMGKLTPTKIEIPEVDDLLEKMKKVTAPLEFSQCHVSCRCLPCRQGACNGCHVERHRDNPDRNLVRDLVAQYRG